GYAFCGTYCPSCGAENPSGKKFCGDCGTALAMTCSSCGSAIEPGKKFCGDCGAPVEAVAIEVAGTPPPVAERRLVSVLFADLVGFTSASEDRDAEETREVLTRYFDGTRQIIERYGGTVEKFIGDAVMAVWGAPVAQEDDAERAVRAALDYEDAGSHELKGKAESVRLWRASRVVGSRRGEVRSIGLEAPFVGRDREFRLVKDLFHATADDKRASLVAVVGVAGIGKSR